MEFDRQKRYASTGAAATQDAPVPGKQTLTQGMVQMHPVAPPSSAPAASSPPLPVPAGPRPTLQMLFGRRGPASDPEQVHAAAARGTATAATQLPYLEQIQRSFGKHDVSGVQAHVGAEASASAQEMGATAYATGDHVVLGAGTDLHTVAHEAAHVVQQRGGVQLAGGVGEVGDAYERHADAVADKVVRGENAEELLGAPAARHGAPTGGSVQRLDRKDVEKFIAMVSYILDMNRFIGTGRARLIERATAIAEQSATMAEARQAMDREFPWNQDGGPSSARSHSPDDDRSNNNSERGSSSSSRDNGMRVEIFLKLVTGECLTVQVAAADIGGVDAEDLRQVAFAKMNEAIMQRGGGPIAIEMIVLSHANKRLPMTGSCELTRYDTVQVTIDIKKKPKTETEKLEETTIDTELIDFACTMDEVVLFSFINSLCESKLRDQQNLETFITAIKNRSKVKQAFIDPNFGTRSHAGQIANHLETLFGIRFHVEITTIGGAQAWVHTYENVTIVYIAKWLNDPTRKALLSGTPSRMF